MASSSNVNKRNNLNLHIDLSSPSTSPSFQHTHSNALAVTSPTNTFRSRSPSTSKISHPHAQSELLPTPDSGSFALPSPSNPFQHEFLPSPTSPSGSSRKRWIRRMIKRNFHPTPLGYAVLLGLLLTLLYTFSNNHPAGYRITTSLQEEEQGYIDIVENEDKEVIQTKPILQELPSIYSEYFPTLSLPSTFTDNPKFYLLSRKLNDFLIRPILSHDDAKSQNYEGCPRELSDKLVNPDQYNGDAQFWIEDVTAQEIASRRAGVIRWLEDRNNKGDEILGNKGEGRGRGIVLTGGNQDTTLRTITAIKHLRRLGVDLPIEVFHYSDELHDRGQRDEIEALGATLREAKGLEKVSGVWKVGDIHPHMQK
ncbi:hypothetical protein I302_105502 [Kwoniella bestiolae CBS 10118]|uniref:Uncharacterized protein n=1 Tax=Kwoniella bestiolae CBS 10118 TaxID=1296100 RepID=A0AAJ8K9G9_9TREE